MTASGQITSLQTVSATEELLIGDKVRSLQTGKRYIIEEVIGEGMYCVAGTLEVQLHVNLVLVERKGCV